MSSLLHFEGRPHPIFLAFLLVFTTSVQAAGREDLPSDALKNYFQAETTQLADNALAEIDSLAEWERQKDDRKLHLLEMLGLSPLPDRTDLRAEITGRIDHEDFTVEKVHFQSLPGLYVTGNLYLPRGQSTPAPTVLYVSGHAHRIENGVSYGNKTGYQRHGAWFASHGYVCLILDTIQLGEIQGIHHGTYREGMWWWNSRGYTPAGVEAWNNVRALDYLETRPEVDPERFGITGRSGGGAYSWWTSAIDERIKAAAPVAGIADLQNHVVDGAVEGHCDCMFMVNTYRWDYAEVAALVAPRPLLLVNTDHDTIFPLDGVMRVYWKVRHLYDLYDKPDHLGLVIAPGPHKDTQDIQVPVFRWFNQHLRGEDPLIRRAAEDPFPSPALKVFSSIPEDERTSKIHESFVPQAEPSLPEDSNGWRTTKDHWTRALNEKVFAGWPTNPGQVQVRKLESTEARDVFDSENLPGGSTYMITSQKHIELPLHLSASTRDVKTIELRVLNSGEAFGAQPKEPSTSPAQAYFAARSIGLSSDDIAERKQIQIRRRYMLLGQTVDGMRVWDIRRAIQALTEIHPDAAVRVTASGDAAVNALYASLFEPAVTQLALTDMPASHRDGPDYLNVMRFLDIPQAVALAQEKSEVTIKGSQATEALDYAKRLSEKLSSRR